MKKTVELENSQKEFQAGNDLGEFRSDYVCDTDWVACHESEICASGKHVYFSDSGYCYEKDF